MTRTAPTDLEHRSVEHIACTYCGAQPRHWCVTARGADPGNRWATWLHEARQRPLWETWRDAHRDGRKAVAELIVHGLAPENRGTPWGFADLDAVRARCAQIVDRNGGYV